ncbi:MAG: helix-turn-helix domain-containing protein [Planctomycetota bacterium]
MVELTLPPLAERAGDLPRLVEHFVAGVRADPPRIAPAVYAELSRRAWPGNLRQLRNTIEAALVTLGTGPELRPEHLPPGAGGVATQSAELGAAVAAAVRAAAAAEPSPSELYAALKAEFERALIHTALEVTQGNQVAASQLLGMNRATFRRKMADHGLGSGSED